MVTPPLPPSSVSLPPSSPPFTSLSPGDKPGLWGLTGDQWHVVMILALFFCFTFLLLIIVAWQNSEDISFMWLRVQQGAEMTRMGLRASLFGHLLSENDIRIIRPGIIPRPYTLVDFFLVPLFFPQYHMNRIHAGDLRERRVHQ